MRRRAHMAAQVAGAPHREGSAQRETADRESGTRLLAVTKKPKANRGRVPRKP